MEREERKRLSMSWSDVAEEILCLIMRWLCRRDRVRLLAVCKGWSLTPIEPIDNLPWILSICSRYNVTLFKPFSKQHMVVEDEDLLNFETKICASRRGWVLLARRLDPNIGASLYRVFNPLTQEKISLPILEWPEHQDHTPIEAAFSSEPTSPDCEFFVPLKSKGNQVFMSTYSMKDEKWKLHTFTTEHPWCSSPWVVTYMEGSFYGCTSNWRSKGALSSFNVATQEWRPLSNVYPSNLASLSSRRWADQFLTFGRHLYLFSLNFDEPGCHVLRFDWSDRVWKKVESLGGGTVFAGYRSYAVDGVASEERTRVLANRVYYFPWKRETEQVRPMFFNYGPPSSGARSGIYDFTPEGLQILNETYVAVWVEPPVSVS